MTPYLKQGGGDPKKMCCRSQAFTTSKKQFDSLPTLEHKNIKIYQNTSANKAENYHQILSDQLIPI